MRITTRVGSNTVHIREVTDENDIDISDVTQTNDVNISNVTQTNDYTISGITSSNDIRIHIGSGKIKVIDNLESYSAVDALSANQGRVLNEKIENSGFITQEVDPTVHDWAKESTKPNYTAYEVGAIDVDDELEFAEIDAMFAAVFGG